MSVMQAVREAPALRSSAETPEPESVSSPAKVDVRRPSVEPYIVPVRASLLIPVGTRTPSSIPPAATPTPVIEREPSTPPSARESAPQLVPNELAPNPPAAREMPSLPPAQMDTAHQSATKQDDTTGVAELDDVSTLPPSRLDPLPMTGATRMLRAAVVLSAVVIVIAFGYRRLETRSAQPVEIPKARDTKVPPATQAPKTEAPPPLPLAPETPGAQTAPPSAPRAELGAAAGPPPVLGATVAAATGTEPSAAAPEAPDPLAAAAEVQRLVAEARALDKAGKARQAVTLYEQAVALDPNASALLSHLAFAYLNRGDNQPAGEFAGRAVAVDATNSEGWIVLGAARDALGDGPGARDAYKKCVQLGTGDYVTECRRVSR
jgi:Flp pilus assembly protein TadD